MMMDKNNLHNIGDEEQRALRMTESLINGDKKLHILKNSALNESPMMDLYLNKYRESLNHPMFVDVLNAKGEHGNGKY